MIKTSKYLQLEFMIFIVFSGSACLLNKLPWLFIILGEDQHAATVTVILFIRNFSASTRLFGKLSKTDLDLI